MKTWMEGNRGEARVEFEREVVAADGGQMMAGINQDIDAELRSRSLSDFPQSNLISRDKQFRKSARSPESDADFDFILRSPNSPIHVFAFPTSIPVAYPQGKQARLSVCLFSPALIINQAAC